MEEENKSIKSLISKSFGLERLPTEIAKKISEEFLFNLKNIVSQANAVQKQLGCSMLMPNHLDIAIKRQKFNNGQHKLIDSVSGGGYDLDFINEGEVDLESFVDESKDLKTPLEMEIRSHWLAVEGVQPMIPENFSLSKEELKKEPRRLSRVQQEYFRRITEACIQDKSKRRQTVAFASLSLDREVYVIAQDLCIFIKKGVRVNISRRNIAVLTNLMKMAKALVQNKCIDLTEWLRHLLPSVITCIVCKQLYALPGKDNHFDLRNLASFVLNEICKNYNTEENKLQAEITLLLSNKLASLADIPLVTLYGILKSLESLGQNVIERFILPKIKEIGDRIKDPLENPNAFSVDRMEANKVKELILWIVIPVLNSKPDFVDYEAFGYLGSDIVHQMKETSELNRISFSDHSSGILGEEEMPYVQNRNSSAVQPHFLNSFDDNSSSCNLSNASEDLTSEPSEYNQISFNDRRSRILREEEMPSIQNTNGFVTQPHYPISFDGNSNSRNSTNVSKDLTSKDSKLQRTLRHSDINLIVNATLTLSLSSSDSEDLETQNSQQQDLGLGIIDL